MHLNIKIKFKFKSKYISFYHRSFLSRCFDMGLQGKQSLERILIVSIKYRINDWIHRRIRVAKPRNEHFYVLIYLARVTKSQNHVHRKKREPTKRKTAQNNSKNFNASTFFCRRNLFRFSFSAFFQLSF